MLTVAVVVFIVAFAVNIKSARSHVKSESMQRATMVLDNTVLQIDKVMNSIEVAVHNLSWLVMENLDNPDYMYELTSRLLKGNPFVYSSAIAFEPYFYREKGMFWSPFSYREDGKIAYKQLGTMDYDYHYMDWYQIPKLLGKKYWSEPYFDDGGADAVMTTFSYPLYDEEGKLFAIFTADVSLQWFSYKIDAMKPYPNSHNIMIGRGGTYIVHPINEYILNESIFADAIHSNDNHLKKTAHKMTGGEKGVSEFDIDGEHYYVFYAPIPSIGWSVAVVCTHSDILAELDKMTVVIIIIAFLGVIFMTLLCYAAIRKLTDPLSRFAESAREIADGTFNASLPEIESKDEMRTLHNSFEHMQSSLATYMEQLKITTANKERIDSELRIARNIQMGMVPKIFPPFPHRDDIDLFAILKPAKEVGGDLYDFFIKENKLYFIIGDVSGKGIPASLVMAVTCHLFRSIASHLNTSAEIVSTLNNALADHNESNMFCTAFVGILDLGSREIDYCNAGHNAPVMIGGGKVAYMELEANMPLGVFQDFPYNSQRCTIDGDTTLFLYTDGVTEAESIDKALYSEESLIKILENNCNNGSMLITESVVDDVARHTADAEQSDDITILCIKIKQMMEKELVINNEVEQINKLAPFIDEICGEMGIPPELNFNFNLVLEECVSNVVLYAYPKDEKHSISVKAKKEGEKLIFTITDSGKEFDPTAVADADVTLGAEEREIGGLGIFLVRQIMDNVVYRRIDGKNVLILEKIIK